MDQLIINLLVLEWIICFLFFEISLGFLIRIRVNKLTLTEYQEKAFLCLSLGYSFMWLFTILAKFYFSMEGLQQMTLLNLAKALMLVGTLFYIYFMEKPKKLFLKRFLLTKLYIFLIVGFFFIFFIIPDYLDYYMFLNFPFVGFFIIYYVKILRDTYYKKKELGRFFISMFLFFSGIILLLIGYSLTTVILQDLLNAPLHFRLIGDIIQLVATGILIGFLILTPTFSELDWHEKLDEIILILKNGLPIFTKNYEEIGEEQDKMVKSGQLTIIKTLLETTITNKGVSIIEKKGKIMIMIPGEYINGVIICKEKLLSLQILLKAFISKIEEIYWDLLVLPPIDTKVFDPIKDLVKEFFY